MDGIDGVLCEMDAHGKPRLIAHICHAFTAELKSDFMNLQTSGPNELHREALAGNALSVAYSKVVSELLEQSQLEPEEVRGIGAHGQTIRHQPGLYDGLGYTIQTLNPSLLAELTHIDVIAEFRERDVAALGQGAPLVPGFHAAHFNDPTKNRAILNLGGIANLTLIPAHRNLLRQVSGFDCGPGNVLLDMWIKRHQDLDYDENGAWAKTGTVNSYLLGKLLDEPFLRTPAPKSTGRDLFNETWLDAILSDCLQQTPQNIQATLACFTAMCAINHLKEYFPECDELLVCGGGVRNQHLMDVIGETGKQYLPNMIIASTDTVGIDPQTMEAMAFAWLSWAYFHEVPANLPAVTGALGPRILGARYPK